MAKEILIYGGMHTYTSEFVINQLEEAKGESVTIRVNTPGGSPTASFGLIAKIKEHSKNITIKVDGVANSMGAFLLAYVKDVEALDVSTFIIHRAAFSSYYETEMSEADSQELNHINTNLRAALASKIDEAKLKEVKGVTLDDIFSMNSRVDVSLNASEALEIGLISTIKRITPGEVDALNSKYERIAASAVAEEPKGEKQNQNQKNQIMTIEDLKAKHPDVYASVFNLGKDNGISAERDRAGAWLAYVDADATAVAEGIKEGKDLSQTIMAELNRKAFAAAQVDAAADDSAKDLGTKPPGKEEPTALDAFEKEFDEKHSKS